MARADARRQARGFTLLELTVVIAIVALLFAVAADRMWRLQAEAERVTMETVAGTLRSALGMKVAEFYVKGDMAGIRGLAGTNPMVLLAEVPKGYRGEHDAPELGRLEGGSWVYDRADRTLVYRVRNGGYFRGPEPAHVRYRVELVGNAPARSIEGVRLAVVEPYAWTN